jgi:hypothetical protein
VVGVPDQRLARLCLPVGQATADVLVAELRAHNSSLIAMAKWSRALSRALRSASVSLYAVSPVLELSMAFVEEWSVAVPSSPTLEFSCL